MKRELIAMLVAFSVMLFTADPAMNAQFAPANGAYPQTSDAGGAPNAGQQAYPQTAPDGTGIDDPSQSGAPDPQAEAANDRQHAIARASVVQGDVNVQRGESGPLSAAVVNAPLATGDRLQVGGGSRAEVELDYANLIRLAPDTEVVMADLQYHRYQLQLGAGTVIYRVLRSSDAQVEIDTPSVGFRPLGQGEFRISVLNDGTTEITTRSGQGELFGPRGSQQLAAGQTVVIRGDANDPEFKNVNEPARDQFDEWSAQRDSEMLQSQSYRYVSPDAYGADDLDHYGSWVPSQQYGQVWAPQGEPDGWSPYSTGEWNWQDYYGWTWVDSAPWGWAPYHYGRWFHNGGYGWCWWPGGLHASFGWSPALVGFFGWGGFGLGLALGGLGWVALAPFEAFHRWWGAGWYGGRGWGSYGHGGFRPYANFGRGADVARMYRNAAFRGGAITAHYNGFGGPHQRFSIATRSQLAGASAFRGGQLPITPNRASYQYSNRSVGANQRLSGSANRHFFASSQPGRSTGYQGRGESLSGARGFNSGANRNSFEANRSEHGVAPNMRGSFGARGESASPNRLSSQAGGWQRFGDPGSTGAFRRGFVGGSDRGGWHSFGAPQRPGNSPSMFGGAARPNANSGYRPGSSYGSRSYSPGASSFGNRSAAPAYSAPRYSAPSRGTQNYSPQRFSSPGSYSAPRSQGSFSRPSSSPRESSHSFGGGRQSSGGGHNGGGGGHNGGGGGHGGGGGGHHR